MKLGNKNVIMVVNAFINKSILPFLGSKMADDKAEKGTCKTKAAKLKLIRPPNIKLMQVTTNNTAKRMAGLICKRLLVSLFI